MKAQVTLYSKPGCHLCEEMKLEIARANCAEVFELEEVNIESDPELWTRYRFDIPVLLIDGVEMFRHRLTSAAFRERIFSRARMRCD
ncbi:MAG TPA: glutaredoxin family protein [Pyrinomonadaceae bacterium]|nr:glutaredoxin family protein [Pyrinomonadaceae bacterium]